MTDSLVSDEKGSRSSKGEQQQAENKEREQEEKTKIDPSSALLRIESPEVQSFIRTLLEKSILSLKPTMSFERGATYPEASRILGAKKSDAEVQSFLIQLSSLGLLDKQIVDRIIACPSCKSTKIYSKYQCAKCHSFDVTTMQIIEHLLCGYIGPKTSLKDSVICPQCKQKILSEKDYRSLGKTFGCLNCLHRFETPPVVHRCEDCANVFSYNQANYSPVYEFGVSSKTREEFSSGLLSLRPVIAWLEEKGYRVESPREVVGTSGSKHRFDIVAHTGSLRNVLLGDFAFAPSDQIIIATFAKRFDVNPSAKSFVVTYTRPTKDTDAVSRIYGISIIHIGEGKAPVEEQLKRMLAGTPQVIAASNVLPPSAFYLGPVKKEDDDEEDKTGGPKITDKHVQSIVEVPKDKPEGAGDREQVTGSGSPVVEEPSSMEDLGERTNLRISKEDRANRRIAKNRLRQQRVTARRQKKSRKAAETQDSEEENDGFYLLNDSALFDGGEDYVDGDSLFME